MERHDYLTVPSRQPRTLRHNGCSTMLLTITNTKVPATDLGYLLHKNPGRVSPSNCPSEKHMCFIPKRAITAARLLSC